MRFREEILAAASLFAVSFFFWLWKNAAPVKPFPVIISALLSLASVVSLLYSLRLLWLKYRKKVAGLIRQGYSAFVRKLFIVLNNIVEYVSKGNSVKGRTTVIFSLRDRSENKKANKKRLKWRQLEDDRARLSYLYASMIEYKLASGADIRSSDTPDEISRKHTENIVEGELFSYYSSHRYYESAPIDDKILIRIKELLGIK